MNKVLGSSVKSLTLIWLLGGFLSVLLLVGCTTTSTNSKVQKPRVDREKILENRLQLALGYLRKGNHERARDNLIKAMEVNSRSPEIHDVWGLLYQREQEFGAAESHYKKALSYDPTFTRGRNNYGLFLLRLNRVEEAYQQFVLGTEDLGYPRRAELFYQVGITALKLNKNTEAEEAFAKAVVLNPQMSMVYLELAEIAYTDGNYTKSKLLLSKYSATFCYPLTILAGHFPTAEMVNKMSKHRSLVRPIQTTIKPRLKARTTAWVVLCAPNLNRALSI